MDRSRTLASVKRIRLISTELVENLLAGNYRSVFKGPGIEFDEAREYVEGDDVRLIDWNVSSRMNDVYTKTFREERELSLFLVVDLSGSLDAGSVRSRREVQNLLIALFTLAAVQNNDRVGAVFFTDRIEHWVPPMKGKKHALRLIQDSVSCAPHGIGSDLGLAMRTAGEALKRRGMVVVLSDFKAANYSRDLSFLAHRQDVIAVRISDPLDRDFPQTGLVRVRDPETGRRVFAKGDSPAFRRQYREFWEAQWRQWRRECLRRRVGMLEISTDDDPAARLSQFFRRRRTR